MSFEDPIQFIIKKKINDKDVEYLNLREIGQGGPEIGLISIGGNLIKGFYFGGPFLSNDQYIYAPVVVKNFFGMTSFKLSRIDIETLGVEIFGKSKRLIFLQKLEGDKIHFYEDYNKTIPNVFTLNNNE